MYYMLGAFSAVTALLLRDILDPAFGNHYAYQTVWLGIIFAAWYCGVGPSLLALVISALGVWYWFLPPYHSFVGKDRVEYFGFAGFVAFSGVIIVLGESNRRIFLRRRQAEEALRRVKEELEDRVRERTAELVESHEAARRLSAKIMSLQDEERRRIARNLHDSLGQYLTALKINLDTFPATGRAQAELAAECAEIVQHCLAETRTLSHLLHPPLLDERGFSSATRLYVEGFSRRSGLTVNLDLPAEVEARLPQHVELALFRAVQEALTNIHRHAGASNVDLRLALDGSRIRLEVRDNGKGIPPSLLKPLRDGTAGAGVGLAGMRERLRDLDGNLEIDSRPTGTLLIVTLPVIPTPAVADVA